MLFVFYIFASVLFLACAAPAIVFQASASTSSNTDAQARLGEGLRLEGLQRYAEAAREFRSALNSDPGLSDARYHLAVSEFEQHQYPDSQRQFERLRASGFKHEWTAYYLGRIYVANGEWDKAIRQFKSLNQARPLQDDLYYLGFALLKQGQAARAIPILRRQITVNPRDFRAHNLIARAYFKSGESRQAELEFERAEELHRYYLEGKEELGACRSELAAGHFDQAWERCGPALGSDDVDKVISVGMLFGSFQDYRHALASFERARALDPDSPEVNYNLGYTYFQEKDYAQARKAMNAALHERPEFFEALEAQGSILCKLGDDAAARPILERARALRPSDEAVNQMLAGLNTGSHP